MMNENMGSPVGVYRRNIPFPRIAVFFALTFATVIPVYALLNHRPDKDLSIYLFMFVMGWCVVMGFLWLSRQVWKVTLFEGGLRGPTRGLRFRTMAWSEIHSPERMAMWVRPLRIGFDAALLLEPADRRGILITEPLERMEEFREHVRRLLYQN